MTYLWRCTMQISQIIRAGVIVSCLVAFASTCFSQDNQATTSSAGPVEIIYSGKLMGYYRTPSQQSATDVEPCPASATPSEAATKFMALRDKHRNSILVGAGDNFSPE